MKGRRFKRLPEIWRGKIRMQESGSVTVETALVMPLLLVTILGALYLTIHVRNGCCMTASCIEQAISGRDQRNPALFFSGNIERNRTESSSQRTVSMHSETIYYSGQVLWRAAGPERTYKKYYPVSYIRKIRGTGELIAGEKADGCEIPA